MSKKNILVVVDFQKDFVDGSLGFESSKLLDEGIAKKIESDKYDIIFATYDTHDSDYLKTREGIMLPIEHCLKHTSGWELYGKTREVFEKKFKNGKGYKIEKTTFATHPSVMMDLSNIVNNILSKDDIIESIEIVGLVTNMCVISQAVCFQGLYPNAQIIVDASLVDSFNKELHDKTLDIMEGMQIKIINREPQKKLYKCQFVIDTGVNFEKREDYIYTNDTSIIKNILNKKYCIHNDEELLNLSFKEVNLKENETI